MASILSPILTTTGLIGGYVVARKVNQKVGAGVLAAAGAAAFETWRRNAGTGVASALTGVYITAFGVSHPLAKKMGSWPSVLTVTAATGVAAGTLGNRQS